MKTEFIIGILIIIGLIIADSGFFGAGFTSHYADPKRTNGPYEIIPVTFGEDPEPKHYSLNLNEIILVKLTDLGYQRIRNNYNNSKPDFNENRSVEYFKAKADKNGYTEFQMHQFINEFGSVPDFRMPYYFNINILIPAKSVSVKTTLS